MSTEDLAGPFPAIDLARAKRQGLRVALAVTVGFSLGLINGSVLPFLAPLFAAQFLLASYSPPGLRQGLGTVLLIFMVGALLIFLTGLLGDRPLVLLPLLWLCYFSCFFAQGRQVGGAAPALVLVIAIVVPLLDILQRNLGESIVLILAEAVSIGLLLTWGAHALFPDIGQTEANATPLARLDLARVTHQAMVSGAILLAMVALCLIDPRLATAMVIPITVASLLSQFELGMSTRAAAGLIVINLLGGVAASLAFTLTETRPSLWLVTLTMLLVSLLFAGKAVTGATTGKVFGGGLTTFLILFGLGVSPLPGETPELFSTRIAYVLFAILYALCMASLFWPRPRAASH
ncbi:FUSC family protein [Pseudomonas sp. EA_105y_Pfl2_R69]|uniref:FUSC family protein n=1 Tax=Pseudomonas sp. EA_105y_Pfl2_R69 TaxID=3088683 RepID=UPI0030D9C798